SSPEETPKKPRRCGGQADRDAGGNAEEAVTSKRRSTPLLESSGLAGDYLGNRTPWPILPGNTMSPSVCSNRLPSVLTEKIPARPPASGRAATAGVMFSPMTNQLLVR